VCTLATAVVPATAVEVAEAAAPLAAATAVVATTAVGGEARRAALVKADALPTPMR